MRERILAAVCIIIILLLFAALATVIWIEYGY